jgi:hypothetical protein
MRTVLGEMPKKAVVLEELLFRGYPEVVDADLAARAASDQDVAAMSLSQHARRSRPAPSHGRHSGEGGARDGENPNGLFAMPRQANGAAPASVNRLGAALVRHSRSGRRQTATIGR